jgi:hypothetical protein
MDVRNVELTRAPRILHTGLQYVCRPLRRMHDWLAGWPPLPGESLCDQQLLWSYIPYVAHVSRGCRIQPNQGATTTTLVRCEERGCVDPGQPVRKRKHPLPPAYPSISSWGRPTMSLSCCGVNAAGLRG